MLDAIERAVTILRTGTPDIDSGNKGPRADAGDVAFRPFDHIERSLLPVARRLHTTGVRARPRAVFFDRDGTLVRDVFENAEPSRVVLMPGARAAIARLRAIAMPMAVLTNQSAVGEGRLREADVVRVNKRTNALLGDLGPFFCCFHSRDAGCACRKPEPGLIVAAAARFDVVPTDCAFVGDIGSDVEAAVRVGARAILIPTPVTRAEEIARAPEIVGSLEEAVDALLRYP